MVPHRRLSIANGLFETQTVQIPDWRTFSEKPFKLKVSMESVELTLEFYHGTFGSEFRRTRQGYRLVCCPASERTLRPKRRHKLRILYFRIWSSGPELQALHHRLKESFSCSSIGSEACQRSYNVWQCIPPQKLTNRIQVTRQSA